MKVQRQALREAPEPVLDPGGTAGPAASRADELLDGLQDIFVREGFRRVTVGELAKRLRCSRRSLYEHAPSKNDLFLLVLDRVLRRIEASGRHAAASAETFRDRVLAFVEPGIRELREASPAFFADIASLPAASRRLADHQETRKVQLEKIVADGIRARAFRRVHPGVAARAMVAAYRAVTDGAFLASIDVGSNQATQQVEDIFLHGLLHPED